MKRGKEDSMQNNPRVEERANSIDSVSMEMVGMEMVVVRIYVAPHCANCAYSYQVADVIARDFPDVDLGIVDMSNPQEEVPEVVFATPTYLLNGQVWSLGNPSMEQVQERLGKLFPARQPLAN